MKIISFVLIFVLLWTMIVEAGPISFSGKIVDLIPSEYGKVEEVQGLGNSKMVFIVKDAHCLYEAQEKIWRILESLYLNHDISLICVEGAWDRLEHQLFGFYSDKDYKKRFVCEYMKKGLFTGAESFCIVQGDPRLSLVGIEEPLLYLQDLETFRNVCAGNGELLEKARILREVLQRIKKKGFISQLSKFDEMVWKFRENECGLSDFIKLLKGYLAIPSDSATARVIKAMELEEGIDFDRVQREQRRAISDIKDKDTLKRSIEMSLLFRMGKISSLEYYKRLKYLIVRYRKTIGFYPKDLLNYIKTVKLHSIINEKELFSEIDRFVDGVYESNGVEAVEIAKIEKDLYTLEKISLLKATEEEVERFWAHPFEFDIGQIYKYVNKKAGNYLYINSEDLKGGLSGQSRFYMLARLRDRAIVENVINRMGEESQDKAVLVIGGFHAENVKDIFLEKGIGVVVVSPNITTIDPHYEEVYRARMMDKDVDPHTLTGIVLRETLQAVSSLQIKNLLRGPALEFLKGLDEDKIKPQQKEYLAQLKKLAGSGGLEDAGIDERLKEFVEWYNSLNGEEKKDVDGLVDFIITEMPKEMQETALATLKRPGQGEPKIPAYVNEIFGKIEKKEEPGARKKEIKNFRKLLGLGTGEQRISGAEFVIVESARDELNDIDDTGEPVYVVSKIIEGKLYICVTSTLHKKITGKEEFLREILDHEYHEAVIYKGNPNAHRESSKRTHFFAGKARKEGNRINGLSPFHQFIFNSQIGNPRYFLSLIREGKNREKPEDTNVREYEDFFIKKAGEYLKESLPADFPLGLIKLFKEDEVTGEESLYDAFLCCIEACRYPVDSPKRLVYREAARSFLGKETNLYREIGEMIPCTCGFSGEFHWDIIGEVNDEQKRDAKELSQEQQGQIIDVDRKVCTLRRVLGANVKVFLIESDSPCLKVVVIKNADGKITPMVYISGKFFSDIRYNMLEELLKGPSTKSILTSYFYLWQAYKHRLSYLESLMRAGAQEIDINKYIVEYKKHIRLLEEKLRGQGFAMDDETHREFLQFLRLREIYRDVGDNILAIQYALCAYQIGQMILDKMEDNDKEVLRQVLGDLKREIDGAEGKVFIKVVRLPVDSTGSLYKRAGMKEDVMRGESEIELSDDEKDDEKTEFKKWLIYIAKVNRKQWGSDLANKIEDFFKKGGEVFICKNAGYLIKKVGNKIYINEGIWGDSFGALEKEKLSALFFLIAISFKECSDEEIDYLVSMPNWKGVIELFNKITKNPIWDINNINISKKDNKRTTIHTPNWVRNVKRVKYALLVIAILGVIGIIIIFGLKIIFGISIIGIISSKFYPGPEISNVQGDVHAGQGISNVQDKSSSWEYSCFEMDMMDKLTGEIANGLEISHLTAVSIVSGVYKAGIEGGVEDEDIDKLLKVLEEYPDLRQRIEGLRNNIELCDNGQVMQWQVAVYILAEAEMGRVDIDGIGVVLEGIMPGFASKLQKAHASFVGFKAYTARFPLLSGGLRGPVRHMDSQVPNPAYNQYQPGESIEIDGVQYGYPPEEVIDSFIETINSRNGEDVVDTDGEYDEKLSRLAKFVAKSCSEDLEEQAKIAKEFKEQLIILYNQIANAPYVHYEVIVGFNKLYVYEVETSDSHFKTPDFVAINREINNFRRTLGSVEKMLEGKNHRVVYTQGLRNMDGRKRIFFEEEPSFSDSDGSKRTAYARAVELLATTPGFKVIFIGHSSDTAESTNKGFLGESNGERSMGLFSRGTDNLSTEADNSSANFLDVLHFPPWARVIFYSCGANTDFTNTNSDFTVEEDTTLQAGGFYEGIQEGGYVPGSSKQTIRNLVEAGIRPNEEVPSVVLNELLGTDGDIEVRRFIEPNPDSYPGLNGKVLYVEVGNPGVPDMVILKDELDDKQWEQLDMFIARYSPLLTAERVQQTPLANRPKIVALVERFRDGLKRQGVDLAWLETYLPVPGLKMGYPRYVRAGFDKERGFFYFLDDPGEGVLHFQPDNASPYILIGIQRKSDESLNELFMRAQRIESKITARKVDFYFITPDGEHMKVVENNGERFVKVKKGEYAKIVNRDGVWVEEKGERYVEAEEGKGVYKKIVNGVEVEGERCMLDSSKGKLLLCQRIVNRGPQEQGDRNASVMHQGDLSSSHVDDLQGDGLDADTADYFQLVEVLEDIATVRYQEKLSRDLSHVKGNERTFSPVIKKADFAYQILRREGFVPLWLIDEDCVVAAIKDVFGVDQRGAQAMYPLVMGNIGLVRRHRRRQNLFGRRGLFGRRVGGIWRFFNRLLCGVERSAEKLVHDVAITLDEYGIERETIFEGIQKARNLSTNVSYMDIIAKAGRKGISAECVNDIMHKLNDVLKRSPREILIILDTIIDKTDPIGELVKVCTSNGEGLGEKEALVLALLLRDIPYKTWSEVKRVLSEVFSEDILRKIMYAHKILYVSGIQTPSEDRDVGERIAKAWSGLDMFVERTKMYRDIGNLPEDVMMDLDLNGKILEGVDFASVRVKKGTVLPLVSNTQAVRYMMERAFDNAGNFGLAMSEMKDNQVFVSIPEEEIFGEISDTRVEYFPVLKAFLDMAKERFGVNVKIQLRASPERERQVREIIGRMGLSDRVEVQSKFEKVQEVEKLQGSLEKEYGNRIVIVMSESEVEELKGKGGKIISGGGKRSNGIVELRKMIRENKIKSFSVKGSPPFFFLTYSLLQASVDKMFNQKKEYTLEGRNVIECLRNFGVPVDDILQKNEPFITLQTTMQLLKEFALKKQTIDISV